MSRRDIITCFGQTNQLGASFGSSTDHRPTDPKVCCDIVARADLCDSGQHHSNWQLGTDAMRGPREKRLKQVEERQIEMTANSGLPSLHLAEMRVSSRSSIDVCLVKEAV